MSTVDHKIKSISYLVRSLIVITLLAIAVTLVAVYYMSKSQFIEEEPVVLGCGTISPPDDVANGNDAGKMLFKAKCSSCHSVSGKHTAAPGLMGVIDRVPTGDWIYRFIRSGDSLFAAGDPYSLAVAKNYHQRCQQFPELSNEQIDDVLEYVNGRP